MHRAFRFLIRTYPRAFRERWESDLVAFHDEALRGARAKGGTFWRTRFWLGTVGDTVAAGIRLRSRGPRKGSLMTTAWTEWLAALRGVRRDPGFHLLAALTLALGVAATTAVFGVLDGVVLRPLPYPDADRLVRVASRIRMNPENPGPMSHPDVRMLRERSSALEAIAAIEVRTRVLQDAADPELGTAAAAGEGLMEMLGARTVAGRLFEPEDFMQGAPEVVLLANDTWRTRYGGAGDVVGRTFRIDDRPHVVIGVLARDFVPPEATESGEVAYWTSLVLDPDAIGSYGAATLARLRPGVTPSQAQIEVTGLLQETYSENGGPPFLTGAFVIGLLDATVGPIGNTLWLLLAGVGLLLAIACANVANLMLARGADRRGEAVMRIVLGASRGRIGLQLLMQSLVVALAGGALGSALAWAMLALFRRFGPGGVPRLAEVSLDLRVLAFATVVATLTGLLFGLLPALQAARRAPADVLRDGSRSVTGRRGARSALIVVETALALVLVLVSGLLVNGFLRLRSVDPGFETTGLIALDVELRARGLDADATTAYHERLLERVRATPGVRSAALSTFTPFRGFSIVQRYTVEQSVLGQDDPEANFIPSFIVSDDALRTIGTRVVAGRDFDARDGAGGDPVILVSEALARTHWPGATDIVGRRIKSGSVEVDDEPWYTIVGVVSDVRAQSAAEPTVAVYHPFRQERWRRISVLARSEGDPVAVIAGLRAAVRDVDAAVPIRTLSAVNDLARESLAQPRFYTVLVAGFGALALLLALVGIYGTTAYATNRRTREIGVRLALGGDPGGVTRLLVRDGFRLAVAGVTLGVVLALVGARLLESYLFGIQPTDPPTFVVTALAVVGTALLAAWIPARRAARLDPSMALRIENAGGRA